MKIQAYKNEETIVIPNDKSNMDIIISKFEEKTTYKDGKRITERIEKKVNITKKINETAKLVKIDQSAQILEQVKNLVG